MIQKNLKRKGGRMVTKELLDYVEYELGKHTSDEKIKKTLLSRGWSLIDIDDAIEKSTKGPVNKEEEVIGKTLITRASSSEFSDTKKKKFSRFPGVLIAIVLLVLLIAGSAFYGYFNYYLAPDRVVGRMFQNMLSVETMAYEGKMGVNLKGDIFRSSADSDLLINPSNFPTNYLLTFSGISDSRDPGNPKMSSDFKLSANSYNFVNAQLINIGQTFYFNVAKLEDFGIYDFAWLTSKWISITPDDLETFSGSNVSDTKMPEYSQESKKELAAYVKQHPPLESVGKLDDDSINNVKTFHYSYKVNKENLLMVLDKAIELSGNASLEDSTADINSAIENIEFKDLEIWIGKKDNLLYKYKLAISSADQESRQIAADVALEETLKDHNNDLLIKAPAGAKSVEEILNEYYKNNPIPAGNIELTPSSDYGTTKHQVLTSLEDTKAYFGMLPSVAGAKDERD